MKVACLRDTDCKCPRPAQPMGPQGGPAQFGCSAAASAVETWMLELSSGCARSKAAIGRPRILHAARTGEAHLSLRRRSRFIARAAGSLVLPAPAAPGG